MSGTPFARAQRLERELGDPQDPATVFSYARCLDLDEREEYPSAICGLLEEMNVHHFYVPAEYGGQLRSYDELVQIIRTMARRDLTVAIGHGKTYLGAVCVWVAGTAAQASALSADIRAGVPVSLGLTERAHGGDLLAGEVTAERADGSRYRVSGEKWLINNATRGSILALLCRTAPKGGPRGFSILVVDKRELPAGSYRHLDKIRTHGIRGADISGIAFCAALVRENTRVGAEGTGLEILLKSLQLTRILCGALSLGAADHGLGIAVDFMRQRELYGRRLIELPQSRRMLAQACADMLVHEALGIVASRSIHAVTEELSTVSAVTKYLVPTGTDAVIANLTRLLGARAFLKDVHARGMFQKVDRDHRIVGLFDGSTLVNLNSLISQFRALASGRRHGEGSPDAAVAAFDLAAPLPPFDPGRLSLMPPHGSSVLASVPASLKVLREAATESEPLRRAVAAVEHLMEVAEGVYESMRRQQHVLADPPTEAFDTARSLALCFAGAACLGVWAHNHLAARHWTTAGLWKDGRWLRAALARLLIGLEDPHADDYVDDEAYEALLDHVCTGRVQRKLFSLVPFDLGPAGGSASVHTWSQQAPCLKEAPC